MVVPFYRDKLDPDEQISQRHLLRFLGNFDKYLIVPERLEVNLDGFAVKRFRDDYFDSTISYSALLLSGEFYQAFSSYDFILIYQLDALVFSDQLQYWCRRDWDYIGAPWIESPIVDFIDAPAVGNGGFSLRKVKSFLRVIDSEGFDTELERYRKVLADPNTKRAGQTLTMSERVANRLKNPFGTGGGPDRTLYGINEDYFWSFKAINYWPGFRIAPVDEALRFSFEVEPRRGYELNNFQLPFGCHAWNKYDRNFWEPFLLK